MWKIWVRVGVGVGFGGWVWGDLRWEASRVVWWTNVVFLDSSRARRSEDGVFD